MNKFFLSLFLLLVVLQVHNIFNFPADRGFDAPNHRDYIEFLKSERRIPMPSEGWELYQPPLYYLLAVMLPNIKLVQFMGLFSWCILAYSSYYFFRSTFNKGALAWVGTVTISALPVVLYLTPTISNEFFSGVLISTSFAYYLTQRKKLDTQGKIILGILISLSFLAKATTFVFIVSLILSELWISKANLKKAFNLLFLPLLTVILISGWYYARNIVFYRNPFVNSVDFAQFQDKQKPAPRTINFFLNQAGFLKLDLYRSQHHSFIPGTYFSWFYDGHNVILPVQEFSKKGIVLVLLSFPLFIAAIFGYFQELKKISEKNLLLLIYPLLLLSSYILYNLKIPLYSTVKGSFLLSLVIPFGYFFLRGIEKIKIRIPFIAGYLLLYIVIIILNFWINPIWYRQ